MRYIFSLICFIVIISCSQNLEKNEDIVEVPAFPNNVVIIIMDGARYSETYGDTLNRYTPFLNDTLAKIGTVCTKFYNSGTTYTIAGHTAITTGHNQMISNSGLEFPEKHSIFQQWLYETKNHKSKAWLITSKDKLEVLSNCNDGTWEDKFIPSYDCGINGLGTGYRDDSVSVNNIFEVLKNDKPNLLFVNLKDPDDVGHQGNWKNYLDAVKKADRYISSIWHYLDQDTVYSGNTTFIVTNDHGRHLDSVSPGFSGHGDDCDGCRHLCLWAQGVKIKEGFEDSSIYDQRDLNSTISYLLNIDNISDSGNIMQTILKE